ncbi:MAG: pseudouridine synthase [Candidatus Hepatoplasma scabrum]|nr:MAG: pseudouridine synthase [Candidatus Hepatoplasma sp.]
MEFNFTNLKSIRIDKYLIEILKDQQIQLTRSKISDLIKKKGIFVNGKLITKSGYLLKGNGIIKISDLFLDQEDNQNLNKWYNSELIDIIFETDDYIVINKPSNLSVYPGSGSRDDTLVNILISLRSDLANIETKRPGIVHRIDKNTSGVLIIAKNDNFANYLQKQFKERKIYKEYLAITNGNLPSKKGIIDAPIGRNVNNRKLMTVTNKNSKYAITEYEVIKRFTNYDYLKLILKTGRTHQIRVHLKFLNTPILNDFDYGRKIKSNNIYGQFLHAYKICFYDYESNKKCYTAKLPSYFRKQLDILKRNKNGEN